MTFGGTHGGGPISVSGTVAPKSVTVTAQGWTSRDGAIGGSGANRFIGSVRILGDTTVCVAGESSPELTGGIYMGSDYELTVRGGGTLDLFGAPALFGGRYVVAGNVDSAYATTLLVTNASGSATGAGSVTLEAASVLAGSGSIAGAVCAMDQATVSPGDDVGMLTLGSLTLSPAARLACPCRPSSPVSTIRPTCGMMSLAVESAAVQPTEGGRR